MRILLVSPKTPLTYWGFQYALGFFGNRAALPPLGLLTVASLLPRAWSLRLVDLNVRPLSDEALAWADVVLVGAMRVQADSVHEVLGRARAAGRRTVLGGPAVTTAPEEYEDADVRFIGEAEGRGEALIEAILGTEPMVLEAPAERPDLALSPLPRYDLVRPMDYRSLSVQTSRGCPHRCEFCDIIEMFGRRPRVKKPNQVIAELQAMYDAGFRGGVFIVDDNFIGHRPATRALVRELMSWQKAHGHPFGLFTEASVDLARDAALTRDMVEAGFHSVFLGIETPEPASLAGANKHQNLKMDLGEAIDILTRAGLEVMGGFIVGFDEDDPSCFGRQAEFIEQTPMPLAMVGLLTALPGTQLWRRMRAEGRLRTTSTGNQFFRANFEPAMDEATLLSGYADLLEQIYAPRAYFARVRRFLDTVGDRPSSSNPNLDDAKALAKALYHFGLGRSWRGEFWSSAYRGGRRSVELFTRSIVFAYLGEHLIRYTSEVVVPTIRAAAREVGARPEGRRSWAIATDLR